MRYTIESYSQEKAVEYGLGVEELVILRYLADFAPHMKTDETGKYYWVNYKSFMDEFPIFKITSKDSFYRRMKRLVDCGVLTHKTVKKDGTWSYYGFGENYKNLLIGE